MGGLFFFIKNKLVDQVRSTISKRLRLLETKFCFFLYNYLVLLIEIFVHVNVNSTVLLGFIIFTRFTWESF